MENKPTIVAIDDEVEFTSMLREYFELRGYPIYIADRPVKGIELIKEKMPDIVVLDLKMPNISGEEIMNVAKRIIPKAQIIFVTAYDDGGKTQEKMINSGAFAYMDKPLPSVKDLEDMILKAYGKQGEA